MSGYLLQLYEEARPADYTKTSFKKYFDYLKTQNSNNNLEYVTYGEFNRLEISVVDSFRDFRIIPDNSRNWLGRRQSVLLYEISQDDKRLEYIQNSDQNIFYFKENKTGKIAKQHFLVFSMLSFTNEMIKQISDFSIFIKQVRESVLKVVDQAKQKSEAMTNENSDICSIQCEIFGSFNTSEIGLFIFCNQYVDALRIIEFIRCMEINLEENKKCKIFFHSFSFVSKNKYKEQGNQDEEYYLIKSENNIKGTAAFQISLKCGCDSKMLNDLKKKLEEPINPKYDKKSLYFTSVGEQDILAIIPAGRAMMYFQKSTNNMKFFDTIILQKNVRLLYQSKESVLHNAFLQMEQDEYIIMSNNQEKQGYIKQEKPLPKLLFHDAQNSDTETNEIFKKYQKIRKEMNHFAKSIGAVNTLDLLYTDYLSTIAYTYNAIWTLDFQKQFDAILNVIENMLEDVNNGEEWNWNLYSELINNFKQQIYHLSQSNRTFLKFPSCHIRYTGQQDYLLHAYFGVIKKILQIVYLTHEKNSQSELIPLITVDVVPIVNSTLHYEGKKSSEARVMNLNIPNDIMFNFPRGIYYLAHELYHYVAPYDRTRRNQLLTCIILDEIMLRQIIRIFEIIFENEIRGLDGHLHENDYNELQQFLSYLVVYFRDIVWQYIYENYNNINEQIKQLVETSSTPLVSSQLFLALIKYTRCDNNDILEHFRKVCNKCFEELENSSKGFQYETFIKKISSNKEENLGIKDSNIYRIRLNILQYYYADKEEFNSILENIFQSGYIFSSAPKGNKGEVVQDIEWVYKQMWHGINEAVRDVAMITIMGISLSEYLIFVLQCWFDLQIADNVISEEQRCRLGSIFMYYFHKAKSKNKSAKDYRDEQKELFIKRYVMIYYENFQMYNGTSADIENSQIPNYTLADIFSKAEKYWIDLYKSFDDYIERYSYYDIYIQEMFLNMDIETIITNMKENEEDKEAIHKLESLCNEFKSKVTETYNNANKHFLDAVNFFDLKNKSDGNVSIEKEIIKKKYSEYEKEIFECNLNIAHYFQKQKIISSLYDESRKISKKQLHDKPSTRTLNKNKSINKRKAPVWIYTLYDQKKLLPFLQTLSEKLESGSNINYNSLWYRGETAADRVIIPALFRKFINENKNFCNRYKSMRNFIEQAVEEFRFRADGSNALSNQHKYTSTDYVTLLQHYEVNTHFLDWSEDAIAALYFALEKYLNNERLNGGPIPDRPVQVMIFDPKKYNSIRSRLFEKFLQKDKDSSHNHILEYQKNIGNRIPNLSLVENQAMFGEFLPFLHENMECTLKDDQFKLVRYLPIAIWTSKLNARLSAQNGSFIAFNLETPLDICKHISLENIQKEVLKYWESYCFDFDEEAPIFLYIVRINKTICQDIAKWLRAIGMSTERLYPELNNIGNRINHRDMPLDGII